MRLISGAIAFKPSRLNTTTPHTPPQYYPHLNSFSTPEVSQSCIPAILRFLLPQDRFQIFPDMEKSLVI